MLFTIQSIKLFLHIILYYKNLKCKYFIDNITINLWFFGNFASKEDMKRKCNPMMDLLKFLSNKKILSGVVVIS